MNNDHSPEAGVEDTFSVMARNLQHHIEQHDVTRDSVDFVAEQTRLRRLTLDFIEAVRSASSVFTRYPDSKKWMLQCSIDDFIESALSVQILALGGIFNVGRREMRYMLEAATKYVYVDQQLPGQASLEERTAFLGSNANVPRSSVEVIDRLTLRMLPAQDFAYSVHSAFGALSGYTHVSKKSLEERIRRAARGENIGFESASTLRAFNNLVAQTYDLILALIFEGIGPSFTGDLFVTVYSTKERWSYARAKYTRQVFGHFDYKYERQT